MRNDDDPFGLTPRPPAPVHVIGQPLDDLSLHELAERIEALGAEIRRLEEARLMKTASLARAADVFKT